MSGEHLSRQVRLSRHSLARTPYGKFSNCRQVSAHLRAKSGDVRIAAKTGDNQYGGHPLWFDLPIADIPAFTDALLELQAERVLDPQARDSFPPGESEHLPYRVSFTTTCTSASIEPSDDGEFLITVEDAVLRELLQEACESEVIEYMDREKMLDAIDETADCAVSHYGVNEVLRHITASEAAKFYGSELIPELNVAAMCEIAHLQPIDEDNDLDEDES